MRAHAAGAGGVLDVARLAQHDLVQRIVVECRGLGHGQSGVAEADILGEACERIERDQAREAPHAVAQPRAVARVGEHVLLDDRLRVGVGGDEAQLPAREGIIERHPHGTAGPGHAIGREAAVVVGDHDHVPLAAAGDAAAVGQAAIGVARIRALRAVFGPQRQARAQDGVVHQVPPHRRHVAQHRDAEAAQRPRRADAGPHQDGRAVDGTGAEHDLGRRDLLPCVAEAHAHAAGARAVEQYAIDQRTAADREVRPAARGFEVAVIGGDAPAIAQVDRVAGNALALRRVEVGLPAIPRCQRRVAQADIHRAPLRDRHAEDRQRAALADAGRDAGIGVVLDGVEDGQHVARRPAFAARLGPGIEGRGHAADGDLRIDGGGPAHRLAAPVEFRLLGGGAARHQPWPLPFRLVPRVVHEGDDVRAAQRGGRFRRAPVAPGLQQQHAPARILRQPCRERRASGTGTHHDHVVHRHARISARTWAAAERPSASRS